MSKTMFIGDLHIGHRDIHEKFRTLFNSVNHHDEFIMENIISAGGRRNDLYILGDVILDEGMFDKLLLIKKAYRHLKVCLGNHDNRGLAEFCIKNDIEVFGLMKRFGFWLSHCPIHPQEMYRARGNIHGHLHSSIIPDDRYFGVSCEQVDYKPISLEQIRDEFDKRGR